MKRVICLAAATSLMALTACGKTGEEAKAPAAADAAMPAAATLPNPIRKAGLWSHTISSEGRDQVMTVCFDDAMAKEMAVMGQQMGQSMCSQQSMTPIPGGWKFNSTCDMGQGGKVVSEGQATGDFNSKIVVNTTSTTTGSSMAQMNGKSEMTMTAEWKGPCPAGSRAGDMTLPGGMKVNMLDVQKGVLPGAGAARP